MLFSATTVSSGTALGVVIATGLKTQLGVIKQEVMLAQEEEEDTPLQKKLDELGNLLTKVIGVICLLV